MPELTRIQMVVFLQSCDLFSYCKADEVLRISGIVREYQYGAGQGIYDQNDASEMLYCVVRGQVVLRDTDGGVRRIGPCGTFGVRDLLCGRLRNAEARAQEESLILAIDGEDFFDLLANNIEIVRALFRHLLQPAGAGPSPT